MQGVDPSAAEPALGSADEFAALLEEFRSLQRSLPGVVRGSFDRLVLDPGKIGYTRGIEPERVTELLEGAELECDDSREAAQRRIVRRLKLLRATRLKHAKTRRRSTPREYTPGEIAKKVGVHRQTMYFVFHDDNEDRVPSSDTIAAIERFFGVLPGFCSYTESEALCEWLRPIVRDLRLLDRAAEAKAQGITKVAARSTQDLSGDPDALEMILGAFLAARSEGG